MDNSYLQKRIEQLCEETEKLRKQIVELEDQAKNDNSLISELNEHISGCCGHITEL